MLLLILASCSPAPAKPTMDEGAPIELVVTLGESIFALAERAPALVQPDEMDDDSPAVIERLVKLTLVAHGRRITLPVTRVVFVQQTAGVVTGVNLAPMLEYSDLAACRELALAVDGLARAAGWQTRKTYSSDLASMQAAAADPAPQRYEQMVAVMGLKSAQLSIYVKEARTALADSPSSERPAARFLLNTDFLDPVVEGAANKRLFERREQLTGGTNSLPLSVWRPR